MKYFTLLILTISIISSNTVFGQFGSKYVSQNFLQLEDMSSCDIDGDGDADVVAASWLDNKIAWFENLNGDGNYGRFNIVSTSVSGAFIVLTTDIDNDGDFDIIAASHDSSIYIFKNIDGLGTFDTGQNISTNFSIRNMLLIDINNDGTLDIVYSGYQQGNILNCSWFENTGNGVFNSENIISETGDNPFGIYSSDIDGDNDNDILITSYSNNYIAYYENIDGQGTFSSLQIIVNTNNGGPEFIITSDIDGDNDDDIIYAAYNKIVWLENDGLGNFGSPNLLSTSSSYSSIEGIASADIDNDNDNDIVFFTGNGSTKLCWYENEDGYGDFTYYPHHISENVSTKSCKIVDIDNDNDLDIFITGNNKLRWFENNNGQGTFDIYPNTVDVYNYSAICTSDINSDGYTDIVIASNDPDDERIAWYRNIDGQGNFDIQKLINTDHYINIIRGFDIDNDGDNDFVIMKNDEISWYENLDGLGTFGTKQIIEDNVGFVRDFQLNDIDNDSYIDLIILDNHTVNLYKNNGNNTFTEQTIISNSDYISSIAIDDIDNDGDKDVVVSAYSSNHKIAWFENDNGTFNTQNIISLIDLDPRDVFTADINNDGNIDVLSASTQDAKISWYPNLGQGNFGSQIIISSNFSGAERVDAFDVDTDGDIDIIGFGNGSYSSFFKNIDGQGCFEFANYIPKYDINSDINSDGAFDLVRNRYSESILWYPNYYNFGSKIQGHCFFDINQNGNKDSNEVGINYFQVQAAPDEIASFTDTCGNFKFITELGSYTVNYAETNNWHLTTSYTEYNVNLTVNEPIIDSLFFGFYPDTFITNIRTKLIGSNTRCDDINTLWLEYQNIGPTMPNGVIELVIDTQITFISSSTTPDSIVSNSLFWHFDTLDYFEHKIINLTILMPDFNSIGDIIKNVTNIYTTDSTGQFVFTDTLSEVLECSYDPNDKIVTPRGEGANGIISNTETLEYTVRFQNTGNAEAINIKIRDQIDEDLDIQTVQILASSHNVQVYTQQNNWLVFQFDSIMLPDSSASFLESQGFVKYSIRVSNTALPNAPIYNTANIYFDNNPAVVTNTTLNTVECYITPTAPSIETIDSVLSVTTPYQVQWYVNDTIIFGATDTSYYTTMQGNYTVEVIDNNGCSSFSDAFVILNTDKFEHNFGVNIYPNPTTGIIKVSAENIEQITVFNINGKRLFITNKNSFNLSAYPKGIYIVKVATQNGVVVKKVILE